MLEDLKLKNAPNSLTLGQLFVQLITVFTAIFLNVRFELINFEQLLFVLLFK